MPPLEPKVIGTNREPIPAQAAVDLLKEADIQIYAKESDGGLCVQIRQKKGHVTRRVVYGAFSDEGAEVHFKPRKEPS